MSGRLGCKVGGCLFGIIVISLVFGGMILMANDMRDKVSERNDKYHLTQITAALLGYANEHGDHLPPIADIDILRGALYPRYVPDQTAFVEARTKAPFTVNSALDGKTVADVAQADRVVAIFASPLRGATSRWVGFLNGEVRLVPESEWPSLWAASQALSLPSEIAPPPKATRPVAKPLPAQGKTPRK